LGGTTSASSLDLLQPGHREVVHELVMEPSPHFESFDIVAFPVRGFGGHTRVLADQPFEFSSKYGTRIYALQPGAEVPDDREALHALAQASGDLPVSEVSSVALTSPVESVLTRLRIESIADGALRLQVVEHHESFEPGFPIALGVALLLFSASAWLAWRYWKRSGA
jgi:hypothetical protein